MKNSVFITGSSLVCSLGKDKKTIAKTAKSLDAKSYKKYIKKQNDTLYTIKDFGNKASEKFYTSIKRVIKKAIKEARLSEKDREDLHIFIGSTSMKISLDEEHLTHLGYTNIGEFAQKIAKSKSGFTIFSTACTSSANALCYGAKMLKNGKIKKALILGFEFLNKSTYEGFSAFRLLSQSGTYKPFDKKSDGIVLGEACSAMVLDTKRLKKDDFEYLGSSNICDTYSETSSNPDGKSIYTCMQNALTNSALTCNDIDFIKAHAVGTTNSSEAEINAINLFLKHHDCNVPVSILKPFLGHTLGACGTNEIALMLICIKKGFIPASLGFKNNKNINFEIFTKKRKVKESVNILFNFIGFTGNNTCIVLSNK